MAGRCGHRAPAAGSPSTSSSSLAELAAPVPRGRVPRARAGRPSGRGTRARERGAGRGRREPGELLHAAAALAGRPRLDRLLRSPDLVWAPAPAPLAVSRGTPVRAHRARPLLRAPAARLRPLRAALALAGSPAPARSRARSGCSRTRTTRARASCSTSGSLPPERVPDACGPGPAARPRRRWHAAARARVRPRAQARVLAVGGLEPRKQPACSSRRTAARVRAGSRAGLVFAGDGPLRGRARGAGATVLGRRRRRASSTPLYARRALPRLRLARGGLRLHPAGGARARACRRGLRPAGVPRDARRRGPARAARRRRRARGRAAAAGARAGAARAPRRGRARGASRGSRGSARRARRARPSRRRCGERRSRSSP